MGEWASSGSASVREIPGGRWEAAAGKLRVTYGFDGKLGLAIVSLKNLAGSRPVEYIGEPVPALPVEVKDLEWRLASARAYLGGYGGRETARLELTVEAMNIRATLHAVAFPEVSVLRQWFEIRNTCIAREARYALRPFTLRAEVDDLRDAYRLEWVHGGDATYEHGLLYSRVIGRDHTRGPAVSLKSNMTAEYVPLVVLAREGEPRDALMAALEYCGPWEFEAAHSNSFEPGNAVTLNFTIDRGAPRTVPTMGGFLTPAVTLAAAAGSRDNLMEQLYDWQYRYLWDYTNPDYFAKTRSATNWIYCTRNLHDQFAYRLAVMNIAALDWRRAGYEILWDDAGWSSYPGWPPDSYGSVFHNIYEGPDYRMSQRFFRRCGMRWLLWFAGKPGIGILENKEGAWGGFEWRTDGLGIENSAQEADFKGKLVKYLDGDVRRSFHTCSGGSTYSHTFDIQRYSNYNYIADLGAGPFMNYYFSYFEVPDKWANMTAAIGGGRILKDGGSFYYPSLITQDSVRYLPEFSRSRLTMVPLPCNILHEDDIDACRTDLAIYKYLLRKGVAGRYSYMYHPKVHEDREHYYMQRMSHDRLRGVIILRHRPEGRVVVFPRGLLPGETYAVGFQSDARTFSQTGRELMDGGIELRDVENGELVYLNLPDRPGPGGAGGKPSAPGSAVCRRENNIGCEGVGVYWTLCPDGENIESYEVSRGGEIICRVAAGSYWFDLAPGWDETADYAVRAVGAGGARGEWTPAVPADGEAPQSAALGNHGPDMAHNGWRAETSEDLKEFTPMRWVPPAAIPFADLNGTPNQPGGTEGYWEGGACARIGRGWMQASPDAYCVRRYDVTRDGTVELAGRAMKEWYHRDAGSDLTACILLGDRAVMPWTPVRRGDLYGAAHRLRLNVRRGDALRFVAGKSGSAVCAPYDREADLIGWLPVVSWTEGGEPGKPFSLRINCGGLGVPDECGNEWGEDRFFEGGRAALTGATTENILKSARAGGTVRYAIPVSGGLYSLRLVFAETECRWSGERVFDVLINGKEYERDFDIAEIARGAGKHLERVYNYIQPGGDGRVRVELRAKAGEAVIHGLELAGERRDAVRVSCGSSGEFVDWAGGVWESDRYFTGGVCVESDAEVFQASPTLYDQGLYRTGRSGRDLTYRIPLREGMYSVHLKFAEMWLAEPGRRRADIYVNGALRKRAWDIAEAAEHLRMAADLRFDDVSPVNGCVTVRVAAVGEEPAVIQAIECE